MLPTADALSPALTRALESVTVQPDALAADVAGRRLEANSPRHLSIVLRWGLYEYLHAGRPADSHQTKRVLRDGDFEARLADLMPHRNTVTNARQEGQRDGELLVAIDGTRVWIPRDRLVAEAPEHGEGTVYVSVPAARPALSPGFFLTDGSRGRSVRRPIVRLYIHLEHIDAVPTAWEAVIGRLEEEGVTYRAKVASSPLLLPRRDALVVYLGPDGWEAVPEVARSVTGLPGVGSEVSDFTERLAPGLSVAWHPLARRTQGPAGLSFGQHRATAVAQGLVDHVLGVRGGTREDAVADAMREAGIDPAVPFRNLDSPDIRFTADGAAA